MENVRVLVLAAGRSTRIKDPVTKMLHEIGEKKILKRVLSNIKEAGLTNVKLVLGHQRELIMKEFPEYSFIIQSEQLGTGHAVMCSIAQNTMCGDDLGSLRLIGHTLVLFGDKPLLKPNTIKEFVESHIKSGRVLTCSTVIHPVPENYSEGYGTVVRMDGRIVALRKTEDTMECDGGMYIFETEWLWLNIKKLEVHEINGKKEYYLPDMIEIAIKQGHIINDYMIKDYKEATGINTPEQKAEAESYLDEGN